MLLVVIVPAPRVVNRYKEPYTVYIGRGTVYGNPYEIGKHGARKQVIQLYRTNVLPKLPKEAILALKDQVLGCSCCPLECHGDVLVAEYERITSSLLNFMKPVN